MKMTLGKATVHTAMRNCLICYTHHKNVKASRFPEKDLIDVNFQDSTDFLAFPFFVTLPCFDAEPACFSDLFEEGGIVALTVAGKTNCAAIRHLR